jgi:hypothetical protein
MSRPIFVLQLRPLPNIDGIKALRSALKRLLRDHGLQCIELRASEMPPPARDLPGGCVELKRTDKETNNMVTRQEAFPSRWLQAADFPRPAVLEIVETNQETVRGNDGRNTKKPAIYFRHQRKGLIVNATNFDAICKITGQYDSDDWIGHSIELYATTTEMGGKTMPCVRVRAPSKGSTAPKKPAPSIADIADLVDENPAAGMDEESL